MSTEDTVLAPTDAFIGSADGRDRRRLSNDERTRSKVILIKTALVASPRNLISALVASSLIALAVDAMQQSEVAGSRLHTWIWWTLLSLLLIRGTWLSIEFNRRPRAAEESLKVGDTLTTNAAACGLVWGLVSWIFFPAQPLHLEAFLLVAFAMVLIGGAGGQAAYKPLLLAFLVPADAVFSMGLIRLGDNFHLFLGAAFLLYGYAVISFTNTHQDALKSAIYFGFETERLLAEITAQQAETDRARMTAEFAKQQAEQANQGKTTFLAAAGHDLRQPMHALVQYFGHLKRSNQDPGQSETISRMGKSLDSMQDLLDSILEVSKLMTGSVHPNITSVGVSAVIDRIDAQMRPIAENKGLIFRSIGTDVYVRTDEVLLERILRNLTINAIRYTSYGEVVVRAKLRDKVVAIQIFDSGIGIPKSQRHKIFDAFYQLGNDARNRQKGLGLGLAIVKQLGDLLSIKIQVRTMEGRGSMFSAELPIVKDLVDLTSPLPSAPERDFVKGSFIVLIDNDLDSLEATSRSLSQFGSRVLSASSGFEAITRLQGQEAMPHLVISDYRLDKGTGLDAIKMVVENQQARYGDSFVIAALIISGDTAPTELAIVREAGFLMLHKPLTLEGLYSAVNRQLEALATNSLY